MGGGAVSGDKQDGSHAGSGRSHTGRRGRRGWRRVALSLPVVVAILGLPLIFATPAWAPVTVSIGNGPTQPGGSYVNVGDLANALTATSVILQATTSITIVDSIDLSTSPSGDTPIYDLTLRAPSIDIARGVNMAAEGNLFLQGSNGAPTTVILRAPVTSGGSLIDPARVFSTATQVNVTTDAASVQQASDFASRTNPATVQVSAGTYAENVTIDRALALKGNDGSSDPGADAAAPSITGAQDGGAVLTVTANGVSIDGLHLNGAVSGGGASAHGVSASGVDGLTVTQSTLDGFTGSSISTPGSTNVVTTDNLITPTLLSVAVTPPNPTVAAGRDQQLTATGTYSEGPSQDLTDTVTWGSDTPSVATIDAAGLAHGVGVGATTISATFGAVHGETSLTVQPPTVPEAPAIGTVMVTGTTASVPFTPGSDGGSNVSDFDASCTSSDGGATRTGSSATSPVSAASLSPGKTYTCTVTATNDVGTSSPSAASNSVIVANVPSAPRAVTARSAPTTLPTGSVNVSYAAPLNNGGSAVTIYTATCTSTTSGAVSPRTSTGLASPIAVTGLTTGKTYTCSVKATNAIGDSVASTASPAVIVGSPAPPSNVRATSGSTTAATGSLTVTFTLGANNGSTILSQTAACTSTNGGVTKSATHTGATAAPINVTGLTPTKTYVCSVTAKNLRGVGLPSPQSAATTA
jgi:large repetitive protein